MPANDGTTNTWFSILSLDENNKKQRIKIDSIALHYNHQQAKESMLNAKLNNGYADALVSGLWPSMDVLTEQEKNKKGIAIAPHSTYY
jgi:hypothetical protein